MCVCVFFTLHSVQCQLIQLFARGIEEEEEEEKQQQWQQQGGVLKDSCILWAPEQSLH